MLTEWTVNTPPSQNNLPCHASHKYFTNIGSPVDGRALGGALRCVAALLPFRGSWCSILQTEPDVGSWTLMLALL